MAEDKSLALRGVGMTREEAINTLKENLCGLCAYGSQNMESCDIRGCDNREAIKTLEQEPKWIPCSERMPKPNETVGGVSKYYLVQNIYGDINIACYTISGWLPAHSRYIFASDDVIVAWRPLPEPYKEEVEKNERT